MMLSNITQRCDLWGESQWLVRSYLINVIFLSQRKMHFEKKRDHIFVIEFPFQLLKSWKFDMQSQKITRELMALRSHVGYLVEMQSDWLVTLPMFLRKSKTRFVVEYCDWSHFKDYLLIVIVLYFHWSREIISLWNRPIIKRPYIPGDFLNFLNLQGNASRYRNDFDIIQCVFELCVLYQNFNFLFIFLLW